MSRPVRVGDVYQIAGTSFEVTAFDLMSSGGPFAIGVSTLHGVSTERHHRAAMLAHSARLISGGMGQAVEVET
jgi:hypothetical protein